MKKVLFVFGILAMIGLGTQIYSSQIPASDLGQCVIAGRGCCSRHGGVCGCSGGRSKCCDGTLSPSCQCFRDENKGLEL